MITLLFCRLHLPKHCEDGDCALISTHTLHPNPTQLEAVPEDVPLQQSVDGLHLYKCCQVQLSTFELRLAAPIPLLFHTVTVLITMVIAPAL